MFVWSRCCLQMNPRSQGVFVSVGQESRATPPEKPRPLHLSFCSGSTFRQFFTASRSTVLFIQQVMMTVSHSSSPSLCWQSADHRMLCVSVTEQQRLRFALDGAISMATPPEAHRYCSKVLCSTSVLQYLPPPSAQNKDYRWKTDKWFDFSVLAFWPLLLSNIISFTLGAQTSWTVR